MDRLAFNFKAGLTIEDLRPVKEWKRESERWIQVSLDAISYSYFKRASWYFNVPGVKPRYTWPRVWNFNWNETYCCPHAEFQTGKWLVQFFPLGMTQTGITILTPGLYVDTLPRRQWYILITVTPSSTKKLFKSNLPEVWITGSIFPPHDQ